MKLVFRDKSKIFMNFKDRVFQYDEEEFSKMYEEAASKNEIQGETDLNVRCTNEILNNLIGVDILEVGCGRGYLAKKMSNRKQIKTVTAADIVILDKIKGDSDAIKYIESNIENLPFKDKQFDTVVCTHTLEHVQNLHTAINELRRVTKRRLIIVVPKQRPYKYTFSLHIHFFPYHWSIEEWFGGVEKSTIKDLGDWYYHEDY